MPVFNIAWEHSLGMPLRGRVFSTWKINKKGNSWISFKYQRLEIISYHGNGLWSSFEKPINPFQFIIIWFIVAFIFCNKKTVFIASWAHKIKKKKKSSLIRLKLVWPLHPSLFNPYFVERGLCALIELSLFFYVSSIHFEKISSNPKRKRIFQKLY